MKAVEGGTLPVHELLARLDEWRRDPSMDTEAIAATIQRLLDAYGGRGAFVHVEAPPLPMLDLGIGSLTERPSGGGPIQRHLEIGIDAAPDRTAMLWIDGSPVAAAMVGDAINLVLDAVWSKQEAEATRQQLGALDVAVRGIASIGSVEQVLQHIVDRVRELVSAQYAALGIAGPFGELLQFITSGITAEQRAAIGPLPRGHGLLGFIIREDSSMVIDDIARDDRRFGFPDNHPEMHSFLGTPVRSRGRTIGNLYLTNKLHALRFSTDDLQLVERFALHAGIAIENARLHEEIQRLAVVEERQRISQDLHDSIIQSLYATSLSLEDLPEVISEDPEEGAARADRAIDSIHATIRDIRNFIMGLQPELLEDSDLATGIETLAAEFRANTMIDLEVHIRLGTQPVEPDNAVHVLAITREALSNIARHSGATRATVELSMDGGSLLLIIGDNGRGFDPDQARTSRQHGLTNLRSRAEAVGGTLTFVSEPGAGTRVETSLPTGVEG